MLLFFSFPFISKWAEHSNLMDIIIIAYLIILIISLLFVFCEGGHFCTATFENIEDDVVQCDWYLLPIKLQRMYMVFLASTQNPNEISTFFSITSGRETSKKVFAIGHISLTNPLMHKFHSELQTWHHWHWKISYRFNGIHFSLMFLQLDFPHIILAVPS